MCVLCVCAVHMFTKACACAYMYVHVYDTCISTYVCNIYPPQSYCNDNEFIAAQTPMENTVNDVWQLVWQFRCSVMVTLETEVRERVGEGESGSEGESGGGGEWE